MLLVIRKQLQYYCFIVFQKNFFQERKEGIEAIPLPRIFPPTFLSNQDLPKPKEKKKKKKK